MRGHSAVLSQWRGPRRGGYAQDISAILSRWREAGARGDSAIWFPVAAPHPLTGFHTCTILHGMQAIRQIVDAERLSPFINIPAAMRNTKVEIIVLPASSQHTPPLLSADDAALDTLCGSLHEYANPALIPGEKTAWQTTAMEKAAHAHYAP